MPLVAAAVCPHPPLIVPEVAAGATAETEDLRRACDAAVRRLLDARPDLVVVVAAGDATTMLAPPYAGDFTPYGAAVAFRLGNGAAAGVGCLGLLVGGWLMARRDTTAETVLATVDADADPAACAAWGARLARGAPRVALLTMGDGSACRGSRAPGYDDPRAAPYDAGVARALAAADAEALLKLDPHLSEQLRVAGRAPWQVLAGAAGDADGWRGELTYDAAPYGVAYLVATWLPR